MPTSITWADVLLRLGLAALAGIIIGFNRGQRGRAAGPRTMLLVCAAAALATLLGNYIAVRGAPPPLHGTVNMDVLRLPLGILTGVGFLGAGAIVKRGNLVEGVTTAATLWFMSVVGLCFGAGFIVLGLVGFGVALLALFIIPWGEQFCYSDHVSTVTVVTRADAMHEGELTHRLKTMGLSPRNLSIEYQVSEKLKSISCEVEYQRRRAMEIPRQVVSELAHHPGVVEVKWQ